jgi:GntR family transcriptional regulator/MocR family aminotransferase
MAKVWTTLPSEPVAGVDLHLELEPGEGLRQGLERALRSAVRAGVLAAGSRLPATRILAAQLGVSRGTVTAAYDQLIAEGYLEARHGSGTTVASVPGAARRSTPRPTPPVRHNLQPGISDVTAFPVAEWLRSARRAFGSAAPSAFGFGEDKRGRPELRAALADYLGRARGVAASPERIVVTAGYVQALTLLAGTLGPGRIAMEDPGMPYHRELVAHAGNEVVPLPVDALGADPAALGPDVVAAVLTPAHQFPTGATLHPLRRRALIEWARSTGGILIEDDYDGEFRYDRQPVGALQGTAPEHVVYAGTTAKSLAHGLRLGWIVLPERLVDPVVEELRLTSLETESFNQLILADLITTHGYDRQIRSCRVRYRRRRDLLIELLERFPALSASGIRAGLHVTVLLPADGPSEAELVDLAARRGLAVDALGENWHHADADGGPASETRGIVIGYGAPSEAGYVQALGVLAEVLEAAYGDPHRGAAK